MYEDLPPDDPRPEGALHWGTALLAALVVLALAVPVLSAAAPWSSARAKKKPSPYVFTNSLNGRAIFSAKAALPGQVGSGKLMIGNSGTKPIRSVKLTQANSKNPFGTGLEIQVFDSTTKRCIYPKARVTSKPRKGRPVPKPPPRCTAWAAWSGGTKLRNVVVEPRKGKTWKPKERHTIHVRWRLGKHVPPGTTATFKLNWRASA